MPYKADVYNVMIASPGDVPEEREVARGKIIDWNNIHSRSRRIVLLPLSWEHNTAPAMGRPQEVINTQILTDADILVGIFWTRVGSPTGEAISGSVEEIEKHINSGKPAMLYFSNKPVMPSSIDPKQYEAVQHLKKEFQSKCLTSDFSSVSDFAEKFQRHLAVQLNGDDYNAFEGVANNSADAPKKLSTNAVELLLAAVNSVSGQIVKVGYKGSFSLSAGDKEFNEESTARSSAMWDAVMQELLDSEFIEAIGYQGEIFNVTQKGFQFADEVAR
jgi:hypothetical protein